MTRISPEKEYIMKMSDEQVHALLKMAVEQSQMKTTSFDNRREVSNDALQSLNSLIGLSEVKNDIGRILAFHQLNQIAKERGHNAPDICRHMVFAGNPGTAKTTVARLFAKICKEKRILDTGVFIEASRADIVSKFNSNTAGKVKRVFDRADGGVLFIDEAYSLSNSDHDEYGEEAINTIITEMENRRGRLIIIFAGYPDKMESFLDKNPGFRSRIMRIITFPDYSVNELERIAEIVADKNGFVLGDGAKEKLISILHDASSQKNFGNGRFSRNLIENAMMNHAAALIGKDLHDLSNEEMFCLQAEDITPINYTCSKTMRKIGF